MHTFIVVALVASMLAAFAGPAEAQGGAFRGLFGGAEPLQSREHVLDLSGSLSGSYMPDISDLPEGSETTASGDSILWGSSASLTYLRNWKSAFVGGVASGGLSYVREYEDVDADPWVDRWQAGVFAGAIKNLTRRTNLTLQGATFYTPYYGLGGGFASGGQLPFGSEGGSGFSGMTPGSGANLGAPGVVPGLDYAVATEPSLNTVGSARLSRSLTRRGSIEAFYGGRWTTFFGDNAVQTGQLDQSVGGRYRYHFKKALSLRAGYAYRRSVTDGAPPIANHDIDVGVDSGYSREFELARRTTLSFAVNTGLYVLESVREDQDFSPDPRFFVGGRATLSHRWARTWEASAEYSRSGSYVPGFSQPFFGNSVRGSVTGLVSRAIDFRAGAWYSKGDVGRETAGSGYSTLSVQATARGAISRNLAWYGQYFQYETDFGNDVDRPFGMQPSIARHGVTFGLTVWLPLL